MRALVLLCALTGVARAHDTGEAKAGITVAADGSVRLELSMARVDAAELLGVPDDAPEHALDERLASGAPPLGDWIELQAGGAPCIFIQRRAEAAGVRGVKFIGTLGCAVADPIVVRWPAASLTALALKLTAGIELPGGATRFLNLGREAPEGTVSASDQDTSAGGFFVLGVEHMLTGWDHLAFLLALVLACARLRRLLAVVTAFTLAHSMTLALGASGLVTVAPSIVEPIIAASIAIAAGAALWRLARGRLAWPGNHAVEASVRVEVTLCFGFGLVHGLGFAGLLSELLGQSAGILVPLLTFNLGVEVGQILAVSLIFPVLVLVGRSSAARPVFAALLVGLIGLGAWVTVARLVG